MINKNNNKNKKNKNSIYRLKGSKKSAVRARTQKVYRFTLKTPLVSYATPTYTEQNLVVDVWESIVENSVFNKLGPLFSQVKLNRLALKAIPRSLAGNQPKPIWIYLDTNGAPTFNYINMPQLQGSKMLPVQRNSYTVYTSTGRQTDFHYWRDTNNLQTPIGLKLRIRSEAEPTNQVYWSFQISFNLSFRGMVLPVTESLKIGQVADGQKLKFENYDEENGELSDSWGVEEEEIEEKVVQKEQKISQLLEQKENTSSRVATGQIVQTGTQSQPVPEAKTGSNQRHDTKKKKVKE
jgi:hypothetical protein